MDEITNTGHVEQKQSNVRRLSQMSDLQCTFALLLCEIRFAKQGIATCLPPVRGTGGASIAPWSEDSDAETRLRVLETLEERIRWWKIYFDQEEERHLIRLQKLLDVFQNTKAKETLLPGRMHLEHHRFVHRYMPALLKAVGPQKIH